ncbi:MAG TPA: hypothetical protein VIY86_08870, partial [Pirellulaceae bacterium]
GDTEFIDSDDGGVGTEGEAEEVEAPEIPSEQKCCPGVCRRPGRPRKPLFQRPGDINQGECPPRRYCRDGHCRAGQPQHVAPWARWSVTPRYAGGYVGGGSAVGGFGRTLEEGTWGFDYRGLYRPRAVFMNWTCGREQGGVGAYSTDGEPQAVSCAKEAIECAREALPHARRE